MKLIVTGSIAFDYLMQFPGKFTDHILSEHLQRVSLSFLVDSMDKRRGGCAPNIAYTLALLGERPYLVATAGQDFKEYDEWLQATGVDTSHVRHVPDKFTASFFCSTDTENNQIASFYIGAMANASELSLRTIHEPGLVIISPNDPGALVQYAEECRAMGVSFIFDPSQQCARLSGDELRDGISGARLVICNDYEFELIRQKTGMDERQLLQQASALVITRGEDGCSVYESPARVDVPAMTPHRIVDPTGVGDAFRGGLMKGMAVGKSLKECAQLGTVAATYALEHLGGQSHAYTIKEFTDRYMQYFGPLTL
ncbi:MAG TPA: carbohydrate kinase family protein [Vicinamibacterales bacterium]|nr:carbohydrate kinase family protein [Vicinamibacterales bacterium]